LAEASAQTYLNPVIPGDYPDPTILRVGNDYWASATTSEWAPVFPLFHSIDLINWTLEGAVLPDPPAWSKGSYWAPELSEFQGTFYAYYAARNQAGTLCVAVATAAWPGGPYRDRGPLVCQPDGSIDPMAALNENGVRYLLWKEDGNSIHQPTIIWAQRLSEDGTQLVGEKKELIRNDVPWEGAVVEGPFVLRRGKYFYLFYSGGACCGLECNYKLGVARSEHLLGPWLKNPANPILAGDEAWKCPGHGSIVEDSRERDYFLYHAYNAKTTIFTGRDALLDQVEWGEDAWPAINGGKGPSRSAASPFGQRPLGLQADVRDDFRGPGLAPGWQWPWHNRPIVRFDPRYPGWVDLEGMVARDVPSGDYTVTVEVDGRSLKKGVAAGLTAYGDRNNALGISLTIAGVNVWRRRKGVTQTTAMAAIPPAGIAHLRMVVKNGRDFQFSFSTDGSHWQDPKQTVAPDTLPPWDLAVRAALTCEGTAAGSARFSGFHLVARDLHP
jgi:beta-xylosidase